MHQMIFKGSLSCLLAVILIGPAAYADTWSGGTNNVTPGPAASNANSTSQSLIPTLQQVQQNQQTVAGSVSAANAAFMQSYSTNNNASGIINPTGGNANNPLLIGS